MTCLPCLLPPSPDILFFPDEKQRTFPRSPRGEPCLALPLRPSPVFRACGGWTASCEGGLPRAHRGGIQGTWPLWPHAHSGLPGGVEAGRKASPSPAQGATRH